MNNRNRKKYIILCDGVDTLNFMLYYLNSKELKYEPRFSNDIQLLNFVGIDELFRSISILQRMDDFDTVSRMLILRDAETDVNSANCSVRNA